MTNVSKAFFLKANFRDSKIGKKSAVRSMCLYLKDLKRIFRPGINKFNKARQKGLQTAFYLGLAANLQEKVKRFCSRSKKIKRKSLWSVIRRRKSYFQERSTNLRRLATKSQDRRIRNGSSLLRIWGSSCIRISRYPKRWRGKEERRAWK